MNDLGGVAHRRDVTELLPVLNRMDAEDAIYDRARLECDIPLLRRYESNKLWPLLFENFDSRFNLYLFLNAPELWIDCTWEDWRGIMSSGFSRSHRPSEVFDTGRFDDVKLLYKYVGIDVIGAFLREVAPSDRALAVQHLLAVLPLLINKEERDEVVRDDQVFVAEGQLDRYRKRLMWENPALTPADFRADHVRDAVVTAREA